MCRRVPVHLTEVVDRPVRQGRPERQGGIDRNQPVVGPFQVVQDVVERPEGPVHVVGRRVARDAVTPHVAWGEPVPVDRAGRPAGHVEEALVLDPEHPQQPVDAADPQPGEVGDRRPEVRRADRREAEHPARPRPVGQQLAGVEAPHAVADHVHRLAGKSQLDLLGEHLCPQLHPGDRRDSRDDHAVPRGAERIGNSSEIGRQRQLAQADPAETEQAVGEDDWRVESGANQGGCLGSRRPGSNPDSPPVPRVSPELYPGGQRREEF